MLRPKPRVETASWTQEPGSPGSNPDYCGPAVWHWTGLSATLCLGFPFCGVGLRRRPRRSRHPRWVLQAWALCTHEVLNTCTWRMPCPTHPQSSRHHTSIPAAVGWHQPYTADPRTPAGLGQRRVPSTPDPGPQEGRKGWGTDRGRSRGSLSLAAPHRPLAASRLGQTLQCYCVSVPPCGVGKPQDTKP